MKAALVLFGFLASLSTTGAQEIVHSQEPFVEILGIKVFRGMPEAELRAVFPDIYCAEKGPGADPSFDYCSISDNLPPGADGEVTFRDGVVYRATRNWFIPDDAGPLEALMLLNQILTRLTGEEHATCAKVESYVDQEPNYIYIDLPEKILTVQMHVMPERSGAYFKESLRVNPVPDDYKTRGEKMQGAQWCGYVN